MLILFDGLDEVPPELLGQMTTAIKNLVDRYAKNRFIASCRIAAYRNYQNFSRFIDVAIADFDESQIRCFITNWFQSHNRSEWGQKCWSKLNSDEHKATRELAKTPLLLTLICILFLKQGEFPTKRATLYDRAVSTLLSEWDASREIVRQQPYRGLDLKCKEVMLAEIAYSNFIANNLFFQQGEISKQIEKILMEMLTDEKRINGRDVLRAVEEQHGLLVNRYDDIYSFSHLTLQEFLTTKHIFENNLDLTNMVAQHLCDQRWREVFLLLAGLRKADDLLLIIERQIRTYMTTPNLQSLLLWLDEVIDPTPGDFQPIAKRVLAIENINVNAYANINANAITIANLYTITYSNNANYFNSHANGLAYTYANAMANSTDGNNYDLTIKNFVKYAQWSVDFEIYRGLNVKDTIKNLKKLRNEIPDKSQSWQVRQAFTRKIIGKWLEAFRISPNMIDFSPLEIEALDNYLYGNLLLIECERAAVRRTPEVWSQIESRMLRLV